MTLHVIVHSLICKGRIRKGREVRFVLVYLKKLAGFSSLGVYANPECQHNFGMRNFPGSLLHVINNQELSSGLGISPLARPSIPVPGPVVQ